MLHRVIKSFPWNWILPTNAVKSCLKSIPGFWYRYCYSGKFSCQTKGLIIINIHATSEAKASKSMYSIHNNRVLLERYISWLKNRRCIQQNLMDLQEEKKGYKVSHMNLSRQNLAPVQKTLPRYSVNIGIGSQTCCTCLRNTCLYWLSIHSSHYIMNKKAIY